MKCVTNAFAKRKCGKNEENPKTPFAHVLLSI